MNTCVGLVWFACPVLVTVVSFLWYTKVEGHELTARLAKKKHVEYYKHVYANASFSFSSALRLSVSFFLV
jgi:hypothetical protein